MCGSSVGFARSDDGFFYCGYCNSQADDIFDTGVDEDQFFSHYSASCNRIRPANVFAAEPISQVKLTTSQFLDHHDIMDHPNMEDTVGDGVGPTGPSDFGSSQKNFSYEEYYSEIRSRYLTGLQIMIQLQSQALVEKFNVSPLIIGLVGPLWLRFLASTRIMADEWADRAVHDSEAQTQGAAHAFFFMKNNWICFYMFLHWLNLLKTIFFHMVLLIYRAYRLVILVTLIPAYNTLYPSDMVKNKICFTYLIFAVCQLWSRRMAFPLTLTCFL